MTSSSFRPAKKNNLTQKEVGLPLEAWSKGLNLQRSAEDNPFWVFLNSDMVLAVRHGNTRSTRDDFKTTITDALDIEVQQSLIRIKYFPSP